MLNDREKLIELILEADEVCSQTDCLECKYQYKRTEDTCGDAMLADYLIANNVVVREKGKWKEIGNRHWDGIELMRCSVCGCVTKGDYMKFCPSCGSDMRGDT